MFEAWVGPILARPGSVVATAALHSIGLGESSVAERLGELMERGREPSVGTTASDGVVTVRIRATGARDDAHAALEATVAECRARLGSFVFARDGGTLAGEVGALAASGGLVIATAESCTGGLVGAAFTEVAGSSAWYAGGFVTYANARKVADLGVREETLAAHGAVSHETAVEMARGACARTGADIAIATTGVAGPGGGSAEKPVGTVFVAVAAPDGMIYSRRFQFPGDRATVRSRTVRLGLSCLRFALLGAPTQTFLWSEGEAVRAVRR